MQTLVYAHFAKVEGEHWWFVARRRFLRGLFERHLHLPRGEGRALDIGCGTGGTLPLLSEFFAKCTGIDFAPEALALARENWPGFTFELADVNRLEGLGSTEKWDGVTCLSVLYHRFVENVDGSLRGIHNLLKPGGLAAFNEPAFSILRREHDQQVYGARRFRRDKFEASLRAAGFEIVESSYFNLWAFLPSLVLALVDRCRGARAEASTCVQELNVPFQWLNQLLVGWMRVEQWWAERVLSLPLGVSIIILARRPLSPATTDKPR